MAQTVQTPRFWINELQFCNFNNYNPIENQSYNSIFNTLPVQLKEPTLITQDLIIDNNIYDEYHANFKFPYQLNNPFIAVLGHKNLDDFGIIGDVDHNNPVSINFENGSINDGWSLKTTGNTIAQIKMSSTTNLEIGSIIIGSYFDTPHSPDLSLKINYDYSGVKKTTTRGGSTLINTQYYKNPKWGNDLGAWEIARENNQTYTIYNNLSKSGSRIWDLSFSYFNDSDIFPDTLNLTNMNSSNFDGGLNTGTDFYGQVIHRTAGGALPFIFSPDGSSTDLDNFAICTFDQNSFQFDQVAPAVYNVSLKIREIW
tara:strand:+ start:127 stop:1065 length:939 start_codon:yes stop_codon:yes gene_type:complete